MFLWIIFLECKYCKPCKISKEYFCKIISLNSPNLFIKSFKLSPLLISYIIEKYSLLLKLIKLQESIKGIALIKLGWFK